MKQLKLIQTEMPPQEYSHCTPVVLDDSYVDDLKKADIEVAAYWYATGSYEGSGDIIFRRTDGWRHHGMGHCSCYGPLDNFLSDKPVATLRELKQTMSEELREECEPLFTALVRYK